MQKILVSLLVLSSFAVLMGQTATTGSISGTVTDPSGAAVPSATIEITNVATGLTQRQSVQENGQYVFPNVAPGEYTLKATAQGFRAGVISAIRVEVTKSYGYDVKLEVGQVTETVEVRSEARAELQMVDATIGTVIPGKALPTMPLFTRQVNELLTAQPGTNPATGEVTGARSDQSTFTLDGIDVTNNNVGGTNTFFYLGVEGIDEFRASVAEPNASFGRGSGGQVSLISRRGSADFHGGVFWYHQNDNLNANSWTNNRNKLKKAELKDNRYGFTLGGPLWKGKTFFFANYDGRRFPNASTQTRIVPTESLRAGNLRFRDATGTVNSYNLATAAVCGTTGDQRCDPRGLGLSPSIAAMWRFMPLPNDFSQGDGLNTGGFTSTVGVPVNFDAYALRIDHNLTSNWRLEAALRYFSQLTTNNNVLDIRNGVMQSIRKAPVRQNLESIGLQGSLRPNLTAEFRFGRVRNRTAADIQRPNASAAILAIPGADSSAGPIALDVGGRGGANNLLSEPFDIDTQLARKQADDGRIYQFNSDFNWLKGQHTVQFGFHFRNLPTTHFRDDKVLGSLGALVAQLDANGGALVVPSSSSPAPCSATRTTGCLLSADSQTWNRLFAGSTGLIDNISVLAVRDGSFKPLPFGSQLVSDTHGIHQPEFYVQDVWRIRPNLTLTYGFNYGWQTPPTEALGRYTVQTDARTGQLITQDSYFAAYRAAALAGTPFGHQFAFVPINDHKGPVFNTDYGTFAPRAAVAWNPSGGSSFLGKIIGEKKTVIRGGYGLIYDRQNTIQSVVIPSLGVAFGQTINVTTPKCNATGAGGAGCVATSTNPVVNNFRVGFDGAMPVPVVPVQSNPVILPWGNINGTVVTFPELLSFQVDPNLKVGRNQAFDLSIQRELKGDMIMELSYVGRYASRLPQGMNVLQSPYTQVDRASGQSFAQAFDNVANALRAGTPAASVPNQPFFENNVPGGGTQRLISAAGTTNIINGAVSNVFLSMDTARMAANLTPFNNYMSQMSMLRSSTGISNYNAMIATLRKRLTKGYFYDLSYTWSKSLDQLGRVQNSANVTPNSFNLDAEYGPSEFDLKHVFSGIGGYDLPFKSANPILNRVIRGWSVTGIFTARSGDVLTISQGAAVWGGGLNLGINSAAIPIVDPGSLGTTVNRGVAGSSNTGTTGNPATGGSGLNIFSNPEQVFKSFRRVNIASDGRTGRSNPLRGLPRWNIDTSIAKATNITERIKFRFAFDFFNLTNHVDFANPAPNLTSPTSFGVITAQLVPANRSFGSRSIQVSARIDF